VIKSNTENKLFCEGNEMNQNKITPAFSNENVPVVFSANDAFCPYMAVMIESVIENRSAEKNYDKTLKNLNETKRKDAKLDKELQNIKNGWSFKIGRVITWVPRKIRWLLK